MTMTFSTTLRIWCDGKGCTSKFRRTHPDVIEARTREAAMRHQSRKGWTQRDGLDLCPECSAKQTATPQPGKI